MCEMCGRGEWLKIVTSTGKIPDYLILYHKDGDVVNNNLDNVSLRCDTCSKLRDAKKVAFLTPAKGTKNANHAHVGKLYIHKGAQNKFVFPRDLERYLAEGWERGRITHTRPPPHTGKIRITDGVRNRIWEKDVPLPEGWWRGQVKKDDSF